MVALAMAIGSFVYFLINKRNFWAMLVFGSTAVARAAGVLEAITHDPGYEAIKLMSIIYIQFVVAYFFGKILSDGHITKTRPENGT